MADQPFGGLPTVSSILGTDKAIVVTDPAGTPADKLITYADLVTVLQGLGLAGGSGTPDTLAKFTGAGDTVGDSRITDDGTDIHLESAGGETRIGDVNSIGNGVLLNVNDSGSLLDFAVGPQVSFSASLTGLILNSADQTAVIGDAGGSGNSTLITLDDAARTIALVANNGVTVNGAPLVTGTGTDNFLTKWSNGAGGVVGDSRISDDGGEIHLPGSVFFDAAPVSFPYLAPSGATYLDASNVIQSEPLNDGEVLIGFTGGNPVGALISSNGGTVTITTGTGSLDLSVIAPISDGSVQVVGAQQPAIPDAVGGIVVDIEARATLNALLAELRGGSGHGLIEA